MRTKFFGSYRGNLVLALMGSLAVVSLGYVVTKAMVDNRKLEKYYKVQATMGSVEQAIRRTLLTKSAYDPCPTPPAFVPPGCKGVLRQNLEVFQRKVMPGCQPCAAVNPADPNDPACPNPSLSGDCGIEIDINGFAPGAGPPVYLVPVPLVGGPYKSPVIRIRYSGIDIPMKYDNPRWTFQMDIPLPVLSGSGECPSNMPLFQGFDANGNMICGLPPTDCGPSTFIQNVTPGNLNYTCTTIPTTNVTCASNEIMYRINFDPFAAPSPPGTPLHVGRVCSPRLVPPYP